MDFLERFEKRYGDASKLSDVTVKEVVDYVRREFEHIDRVINNVQESEFRITQSVGKALGYPWYKDDKKNFPTATEADGVCVGEHVGETIVEELVDRHVELCSSIKAFKEHEDNVDEHQKSGELKNHVLRRLELMEKIYKLSGIEIKTA